MSSAKFKLTPRCHDILAKAKPIAEEFMHKFITTEHLFISMIDNAEQLVAIFESKDIDPVILRKNIIKALNEDTTRAKAETKKEVGYSPKISRLVTNAGIEAKKLNHDSVGVHHLCIALLCTGNTLINSEISKFGIDPEELVMAVVIAKDPNSDTEQWKDESELQEVAEIGEDGDTQVLDRNDNDLNLLTKNAKAPVKTRYLDQFATDITHQVETGQVDPIIGMDDVTDKMLHILMRKNKNNPIVIGEPGVGKTAAIEALAYRIVCSEVPQGMCGTRIFAIDVAAMVAGSRYRGDFEQRIKGVINELSKLQGAIGFIDEFHTVVGAGSASGTLDASNILKPALARGDITLIGATTYDEYSSNIEPDKALFRRMQPVWVYEPDQETTLDILKGIKYHYEDYHNVNYQVGALKEIVRLADRYICDRQFPDKAIDLLDQVGALQRTKHLVSDVADDEIESQIHEFEIAIAELLRVRDLDGAARAKEEQQKVITEYKARFDAWSKEAMEEVTIKPSHVYELVSGIAKIPIEKLGSNELKSLKSMAKTIKRKVIGQPEAVDTICNTIKRSRVGINDPDKPVGSFLFLGPTGVGKTHITKVLSEHLFGDEDHVLQLDMSEFMEPHSVSKLVGSPPGYVGYEDEPKLIKHIKNHPHSIILVDEIEKAHHLVTNIFLQILEEGHITDAE